MKYLGIDYGSKNIGLATSQEGGFLASEYDTIKMSKDIFNHLSLITQKESIHKIVIGLPVSMRTGKDTEQTAVVREFGFRLQEETKVHVEFFDERLTSKIANRMPKQKKEKFTKDSFAAMLILQGYLDTNGLRGV
jgi:putative holliday junction resolvase